MKKIYFVFVACFCAAAIATGQPSNDDCANATILTELSNWCSDTRAFTNEGATPSGFSAAECFTDAHNDVWFTFVAGATDISVIVIGDTRSSPGGSLTRPEVVLMTGDCNGEMNEWRCAADDDGLNTIEVRRGGLIVGETYYIRVQGRDGSTGSFQLCINNFNPPAEPGSDCFTRSVLCDKSTFSVQKLSGGGNDPDEASGTCLDVGGNSESSSTWFVWTAMNSGPLTFTLTPIQATDDLDFVVFEMASGITNCNDLVPLRCMATACTGPTGLDMTSTDLSEDLNCDPGEDGFVRFIEMEEGKSYALMVNNFSDNGNGFTIDFGDDENEADFLGPQADFSSDEPDNQVCIGEDVQFNDVSSFPNGSIVAWNWTFGVGASPERAIGPGPHEITYSNSGVKSIVLTIETNLGCQLTKISNFNVLPDMQLNPLITPPDCGGGTNGIIEMQVTDGASPYEFNWDNSGFLPDNATLTGLAEGDFTVVVRDAEGCTTTDTVFLREPGPALDASVDPVVPPICLGEDNGQIVIQATEGTPPYSYDFGTGLVNDNVFRTGAGVYNVRVVDAQGCDSDFVLEIVDPPLLTLDVDPTDITCNGLTDGSALATAGGGHEGFSIAWSNGATGEMVEGLPSGDFTATVTDMLGCMETVSFTIQDAPAVELELVSTEDPICFGQPEGSIEVLAMGGIPPYEYSADGSNFQSTPILGNLLAGTYSVMARDSRGCIMTIEDIVINEAPEFTVEAGPDQTVNLGESTRLAASTAALPADFLWTGPDSLVTNNSASVTVFPFISGIYTVSITNAQNCIATDSLQINVVKTRPVHIPNVFSPNGDGVNDRFILFGGFAAREIRSLRVFSRWGELVYETRNIPLNDERFGWDGTFNGQRLGPGVFAFFAEVEFLDSEVLIFEGDVTLVR